MASLAWISTVILSLLCLSFTVVQSKEVKAIEEKFSFHDDEFVIFDRKPLKNNTLLYTDCGQTPPTLNCSVNLLSYLTAKRVDTKVCQISRRIPDHYWFAPLRLELLSLDQVIFMWMERLSGEHKPEVSKVYYRTVNMSDCNFVEHKLEFETTDFNWHVLRDLLILPYEDSFDLLFHNKSLCGDYFCRQTHDRGGNFIGGPVASYVKSEATWSVLPAMPRSPALRYFAVSYELRLVGSNGEKDKHLMMHIYDGKGWTFTGNNGYLGYCWMLRNNGEQLNCTQFDSQGKQTLQFLLKQKQDSVRKFEFWMALSNLRDGGMLLLTSDCDNSTDCIANVDKSQFNVYKIQKVGGDARVEHLHRFTDIHCNGVKRGETEGFNGFPEGVKMELHEQEDGGMCINLACVLRDKGNTEINFTSKCIRIPESERGPSIQEQKGCIDPDCYPDVFTPYNL